MLQRLLEMFMGKSVRITHTNNRVGPVDGACKTVHQTPGEVNRFDLELEDGYRIGFVPEVVTDTSVDGPLSAFAGGRRKIEVVDDTFTAEEEVQCQRLEQFLNGGLPPIT